MYFFSSDGVIFLVRSHCYSFLPRGGPESGLHPAASPGWCWKTRVLEVSEVRRRSEVRGGRRRKEALIGPIHAASALSEHLLHAINLFSHFEFILNSRIYWNTIYFNIFAILHFFNTA